MIDYHREPAELEALVDAALGEARRQGASSAAATAGANFGLSVTVRLGELETIEHHRNKSLGVTVYFGQRQGSATTTDFRPEALRETVAAACRIAAHTEDDPCAGLADAELMAREVPDLELFHPWGLTPERATELALETEAAARDLDPRITNSEGATVSELEGAYVYGNTHGFVGGYASTRHSIACAAIAEDGSGMQRDDWYTISREPDALEPAQAVGRRAAERALGRLGAQRLATRSVPAIFAADQATRLFRSFIAAIQGASLYRQASFLLDHLGKPVFADWMDVREEPHLPRALGSAPFDNEGVATRPRHLVRGGLLEGYVLDSYSARKLGLKTTGNAGGVHNLVVSPGRHDLAALLDLMGTGVLVTELMGMGVNIVTGDYSRGFAGFWVEGGRIRHPVQEVTIAGNLRDMFRGIREVGTDVDRRGGIRTGSVLIDRMTVAGE